MRGKPKPAHDLLRHMGVNFRAPDTRVTEQSVNLLYTTSLFHIHVYICNSLMHILIVLVIVNLSLVNHNETLTS